jgi:hypothetical protein
MTGLSLPPSPRCVLTVESGNRHFHRTGDFIASSDDRCLVRYFGRNMAVTIADEIVRLDDGCFRYRGVAVTFGSASKLSSIGSQAFAFGQMERITLPSSVSLIGDCCFDSAAVRGISFCAGSQLETIPEAAFADCYLLESLILPASVKTIGEDAFCRCSALQNSPIPLDSKLVRIEAAGFGGCSALQAMLLPATVEFIGGACFLECDALSSLTFGSPSTLRELLSLPPKLSGFVAIPDSVERLAVSPRGDVRCALVLTFGTDSRLSVVVLADRANAARSRGFLQVSSRSLPVLRKGVEFPSGE